jgi:hypothetical protein
VVHLKIMEEILAGSVLGVCRRLRGCSMSVASCRQLDSQIGHYSEPEDLYGSLPEVASKKLKTVQVQHHGAAVSRLPSCYAFVETRDSFTKA